MDPHGKFIPPKDEAEFEKRVKEINLPAAVSILDTLKTRRAAMLKDIDAEIEFYEKVVTTKKERL